MAEKERVDFTFRGREYFVSRKKETDNWIIYRSGDEFIILAALWTIGVVVAVAEEVIRGYEEGLNRGYKHGRDAYAKDLRKLLSEGEV